MKKILIFIMAFSLTLLTGCEDSEVKTVREVKTNLTVESRVTSVKYRDIESATYEETRVSYYIEELSFPKEGYFDQYYVALGDYVTKGTVIASSDTEDLEKQLEIYEKNLKNVTDNYNTNLKIKNIELEILNKELEMTYEDIEKEEYMSEAFSLLCRKAGVYYEDIKKKELEIKELKEEYQLDYPYYSGLVEGVKSQLGTNVITAPFDGYISAIVDIQAGDYINEDSFLVAISDESRKVVTIDYMTDVFFNRYEEVYALINGEKYQVEYVPMDENVYSKMRARGESMYLTLLLEDKAKNLKEGNLATVALVRKASQRVLSVPSFTVSSSGGKTFVYQKIDGERCVTEVKTGVSNGSYIEIKEGLKEGDIVYED